MNKGVYMNCEAKPDISIIIPVYNGEKSIEKAIKSVQEQEYRKWEIIAIDDGSTDKTLEMLNKISKLDKRIIVCHQKNSGVSVARNTGIKKAAGKYVMFLDCDDEFLGGYLESAIKFLQDNKSDILMVSVLRNESKVQWNTSGIYTMIDDAQILFDLSKKRVLFNSVCNKVFKKDIIDSKGLNFPTGRAMGEDLIFVQKYLNCIDSVGIVDVPYYKYKSRANSATSRNFDSRWTPDAFYELWECYFAKNNLNFAILYERMVYDYTKYVAQVASAYSYRETKIIARTVFMSKSIQKACLSLKNTDRDSFFSKQIRKGNFKTITMLCVFLGFLRNVKRRM